MSSRNLTKPRGYYEDLSSSSLRSPAQLNDPKDDHITYEELNNCDGMIVKQPTFCLSKSITVILPARSCHNTRLREIRVSDAPVSHGSLKCLSEVSIVMDSLKLSLLTL